MSSPEAAILADFLLAPAALRDILTLQQFTDIFPKNLRTNPAVKDLYHELQRQRYQDINTVKKNIATELSISKSLQRQSARARQGHDRIAVAGIDTVILNMEGEASILLILPPIPLHFSSSNLMTSHSFPAVALTLAMTKNPIQWPRSNPAYRKPARLSRYKLPASRKNSKTCSKASTIPSANSATSVTVASCNTPVGRALARSCL